MPLAYSYARFSTPEQAQGDSKRRQNEAYEGLCKKHNLTAATRYFDEGISAFKGKNADIGYLGEFRRLVQAGEVPQGSYLVVESLDRLSREGFDECWDLLKEIIRAGVIVATTTPERIYEKASLKSAMATMEILFIASRANEESETKSRRVKEAWEAKKNDIENGKLLTRRLPEWLTMQDDRIVPIPERAKVVKQVFKWATEEGLGQRAIAKRLNSTGVPSFRSKSGKLGKQWGWAYVRLLLTDGRAGGTLTTKSGDKVRKFLNYYPPVVDQKTIDRAAALTDQRRRFRGSIGTKVANLFQGLAFDVSGCSMLHIRKAADKPARFIPSKFELGHAKGCASIPYDTFERIILKVCEGLTLADIGKTKTNELGECEDKLTAVEGRLARARRALESFDEQPEAAIQAMVTLDKQRKALQIQREKLRQAQQLSSAEASLAQARTILEKLNDAKGQKLIDLRFRLRQAIRGLVSRIVCETTREGWTSHLHAAIHFKSGGKQELHIFVRRERKGCNVLAVHNHKFNGEKYPNPRWEAALAKAPNWLKMIRHHANLQKDEAAA